MIGGNITTENGSINYESTITKEWINGYSTFDNPYDDKYIISGSRNGNMTVQQ